MKKSTISPSIVVTCTLRARYRLVDRLPRAISTSLSTSLSTSPSVTRSATPVSLLCYHNIIAPLRQHHCPATATSLFCYGNIILLLFNALSWLFSVLVVKLIEPIKVKKWASIVRIMWNFRVFIVRIMWKIGCFIVWLCENRGAYAADYVKIELF